MLGGKHIKNHIFINKAAAYQRPLITPIRIGWWRIALSRSLSNNLLLYNTNLQITFQTSAVKSASIHNVVVGQKVHNSFKSENYLVDQQLQNIQREAREIYSNTVQIQPELIPG